MKTKSLNEQVALITGGGTGIGRAFAESLAQASATVVIASRRQETIDQTAYEINLSLNREKVFSYAFDIRSKEQCESLVSYAENNFGAIDLLINNSGLAVPETVTEITDEGWDKVLETNLKGAMWLTKFALPKMIEQDFGDVVFISSQAGKNGYADVPSYCASKFGLLGYAESLRDHVRKENANIRVFNFCPGLVDVENTQEGKEPRAGFIHIANMAKTLMFALSLDRNVILEDINLYSR